MMLTYTIQCRHHVRFWGHTYEEDIKYDPQDYKRWQEGKLIQHAMPYLTASQREMLMTRTCNKCWNHMFPPEDDDA